MYKYIKLYIYIFFKKSLQLLEELSRRIPYLDIVSGEYFSKIKDLKHRSSTVVSDAVSLQNVLGDYDFPGQPALAKCSIE